mmetsp:Transcript_12214/g.26590  ORF Transcript_12214/g.26590 Transcript_12214/m.26590 type:complete len:223 (-) Transcript_12214:886-1554(-)
MVDLAFSAMKVTAFWTLSAASTTFFTCVPTSVVSSLLLLTSFSSSMRITAAKESIITSSSSTGLPCRTKTRNCSNTGPLVRLIRTSPSTKGVSKVPTLMNSPRMLFTPKTSAPSGSKNWDVPATFKIVLVKAILVLKTGATLSTSALCTNTTLLCFTCNGFTLTFPNRLNNGDSVGIILSRVFSGVNSTTLSTRLISPLFDSSEAPSFRMRWVTEMELESDF